MTKTLENEPAANDLARVLVIVAHPDDAEAGAGGTIAHLVKRGAEVTYVIVTNGNTGSSDRTMTRDRLTRIRETEQREAARTLGVSHVEFLGYNDAELEDTRGLRLDITRQIRKWRPDRIITQNPHRTHNLFASHRDHRVTGSVVLDCVYPLARDHLAFPELLPEYESHRVREVHIMQWQADTHELAVDISATLDLKLKAFACHTSQFPDFAAVAAHVRDRCAALGKPYGYAFAETFDRILVSR
jgi:LmbE family N-acetylglucosaminyl deacetylase